MKSSEPTLCMLKTGETYVLNLPAGHGWELRRWVELSLDAPDEPQRMVAAISTVTEVWSDAAKVSILYQRERKLQGAHARVMEPEEHARLGKFVGRVIEVEGNRAQIDIGGADDVKVDEVYSLRNKGQDEQSVARIRVTSVADRSAWGTLLDPAVKIEDGQTAVYLHDAEQGKLEAGHRIGILDFHAANPGKAAANDAGEVVPTLLAQELAEAGKEMGVQVSSDPELRIHVKAGEDDDDTHEKIAERFLRFGKVQFVIWGTIDVADKRVFVQPRYTYKDSEGYAGIRLSDFEVHPGKGGLEIEPDELGELTGALLGTIAFWAGRYGDTEYYLQRALTIKALRGKATFFPTWMLSRAHDLQGQTVAARLEAAHLRQAAVSSGNERQEASARAELGRMDRQDGNLEDAREHLVAVREWSEESKQDDLLKFALSELAQLAEQEKKDDEARKAYEALLDVEQRTHDRQGEANTLYFLASIDARQGRYEDARKKYEAILEIRLHGGEKNEAYALQGIANMEAELGRPDEARKAYEEAIAIYRRIGDVQDEAVALQILANFERAQERPDRARELFQQLLALRLRSGNVRGAIDVQIDLGYLDYIWASKRKEGRASIEEALTRARSIRDAGYEARCLYTLGFFDLIAADLGSARAHFQGALDIAKKPEDASLIKQAENMLASIPLMESSSATAWAAHPSELKGGGVFVFTVHPNSEAAKAGVEAGDIVIRYGTTRIDKWATLRSTVVKTSPQKTVKAEILRGKKKLTVEVHGGLLGINMSDLLPKPASTPAKAR